MKWQVRWQKWGFKEGKIVSIDSDSCRDFTIEAASIYEAVQTAELEAPRELARIMKEFPERFLSDRHYTADVLSLMCESGDIHKLKDAQEVFGGTVRGMDNSGSPD